MAALMRGLTLGVALAFAGVFLWGVLQFADAPIAPCAQGFCGKYGAVHAQAHYQAYLVWRNAIVTLFLLAFACAIGWNITDPPRA